MAIKTTINIHNEILDKITKVSYSLGKSRTEIIIMLLMQVMKNDTNKATICKSIKYQKCDGNKKWHKFHIILKDNEYEYLLDLRRLLKMSVSLLLAFSVKKYLKKLSKCDFTDNYLFKNYILAREIDDGVISWKLFWNIPNNLSNLLPPFPA